jgi:uncharacterized protein (DUF1499 family)
LCRNRNIILLTMLLTLFMFGCSSNQIYHFGVANGRLSPCPSSPNCCSSQSITRDQFIEPIQYEETQQMAQKRMISLIERMKRAKIITVTENYLHAEFTSAFFRFVDDVELYFDDTLKTIHMRSAARTGYYDFGVNRKRLEAIKSEYQRVSEQK